MEVWELDELFKSPQNKMVRMLKVFRRLGLCEFFKSFGIKDNPRAEPRVENPLK